MTHSIIRKPQVKKRTGLPNSTIDRLITLNKFPKPISIGVRSVGWIESEIDEWIDQKIKQSRSNSK